MPNIPAHVIALTRKVSTQCITVENDDPAKIAEITQNQIAPTAIRNGIISSGFADFSTSIGETDRETDGETDGEPAGEIGWASVEEETRDTIGEMDILTEMID